MARLVAYVGIWLIFAVFLAGFVGRGPIEYYRLMNKGQRVEGVAIARELHQQIKYSFTDGKQEYTAVGMVGLGTPEFEEISLGDHLPVYYLPDSPAINCLGDPRQLLRNELPIAIAAPLLFPTFLVIAIEMKRQAKKTKPTRT